MRISDTKIISRSNSTTPQGDGNLIEVTSATNDGNAFKFHYPARGRKRSGASTKTCVSSEMFKFHYPARGRKRKSVHIYAWAVCGSGFKFHYPARGQSFPTTLSPHRPTYLARSARHAERAFLCPRPNAPPSPQHGSIVILSGVGHPAALVPVRPLSLVGSF